MNNKIRYVVSCLLLSLIITGCQVTSIKDRSKAEMFPNMYQEKPRSLLVMPPINLSTAADAKDLYATTLEMPIAFQGYYTFPYELTSEILKQQGVYDTELVYNLPMSKFKEYFGADAVLFTKIVKWDTVYAVIASNMVISLEAEIKSTTSDKVLWKYAGTVVVNLSGGNNNSGLAGLVLDSIVTAIQTAAADYTEHSKKVNEIIVDTLPYGPYHPLYLKDQDQKVRNITTIR